MREALRGEWDTVIAEDAMPCATTEKGDFGRLVLTIEREVKSTVVRKPLPPDQITRFLTEATYCIKLLMRCKKTNLVGFSLHV